MLSWFSDVNLMLIGKIWVAIYLVNFIVAYSDLKEHYKYNDIRVGDVVLELFKNFNPFRSFVALGYSLDWIFRKLDFIMNLKLIERPKNEKK